MKRFLLGVLCGLALPVAAGLLIGLVFWLTAGREPDVKPGTTLVVDLGGDLPERAPLETPLDWLGGRRTLTMPELWELFAKAAADKRIAAVWLRPSGLGAGWAKLREVRDGAAKVRRAGKPVFAYLRNAGMRDYYVATAAERIYSSREDLLDVKGLRAELVFLRQTLDKLGVEVEIEHAGRYKDAGDMFTRTSMTPETRESVDALLDGIWTSVVSAVAESRRKTAADVRAAIDQGPFLATQAAALGLIEPPAYEDEAFDALRQRLNQIELAKLDAQEYTAVSTARAGLAGRAKIALVVAEGDIRRSLGDPLTDEEGIIARPFAKTLEEVAERDDLAGVIVRIDSPGGDAVVSDELLRAMSRLSKRKPLVISMSDVAASGGYYMAMTGDPVVAYPETVTGSIGVIFGKVNLRGLYDKLGVRKEYLTRGRFATIDSDYQPLDEAGRRKLREGIDAVYRSFVSVVAAGRKKPAEAIEPLAQGRVWLGVDARRHGLVDELGGIDRAIELVKTRAKLDPKSSVDLVVFPGRESVWKLMWSDPGEVWAARTMRQSPLREPLKLLLGFSGVMRRMPYNVEIR